MQLITTALLALAAGVLALPTSEKQDPDQSITSNLTLAAQNACGSVLKKPVCCRESHLGLVDTDCHAGPSNVKTGLELQTICVAAGKMPRCCILGVLGLYLACGPPPAVAAELGYYDDETALPEDFPFTSPDEDGW
ncbi:hypothetical protein diail_7020 [Diaporthe ilicicola]|nr:hypothetical protein diail_7020 [Diaporthe ilicicola]